MKKAGTVWNQPFNHFNSFFIEISVLHLYIIRHKIVKLNPVYVLFMYTFDVSKPSS